MNRPNTPASRATASNTPASNISASNSSASNTPASKTPAPNASSPYASTLFTAPAAAAPLATTPTASTEPCRILRLTLAGFGVYERPTRFVFPHPAALLQGPNESGKSTLLHGLSAVLFGLPSDADSSRFGSGRFRSFSHPKEFWGEVEWEREGRRFTLHRAFESHRVKMTEETPGGKTVLYDGEHNPRATSSAGSSFTPVLRSTIGLSDRDLFVQTFCVVQGPPDDCAVSAELQHLLSGSRAGRMDWVLETLFAQIKDLTRATGDLGILRPGKQRPSNQSKAGRCETLEEALREARRVFDTGQDVLGRLNLRNDELEGIQRKRRALEQSRVRRQARLDLLRKWCELNEERIRRGRLYEQIKSSVDQVARIENEQARLAGDLEGRYARYRETPEDLQARLDALDEADRAWNEAREKRRLSEAEREALADEARVFEARLNEEFADVKGRPELCELHERLGAAVAQREKRRASIRTSDARIAELESEVEELCSWESLSPAALRSEAELLRERAADLRARETRLAEISGLLEGRDFLAGPRLDALRAKIQAETKRRELRARVREMEAGLAAGPREWEAKGKDRSSREAEIAALEQRLSAEFADVRGRPELPAIRAQLVEALSKREQRQRAIQEASRKVSELEEQIGAEGPDAVPEPEAWRLEVAALREDMERCAAIDIHLRRLEEKLQDRALLPPPKLHALKEKIQAEQEARDLTLRLHEVEAVEARRALIAATETPTAARRAAPGVSGPILIALGAGALISTVLFFAPGVPAAAPAAAGAGVAALVFAVLWILRRRSSRSGLSSRSAGTQPARVRADASAAAAADAGASAAAEAGAASETGGAGAASAASEASGAAVSGATGSDDARVLRARRDALIERSEALRDELRPFDIVTASDMASMEARWVAADEEAARLRSERRALVARRFGVDFESPVDPDLWRGSPVERLPEPTRRLNRIPGAPQGGSAGALIDWALALTPSTWLGLSERRNERARLEASLVGARLELERLRNEAQEDEPERLRLKLAPFTEATGAEELEARLRECRDTEEKLRALKLHLDGLPAAANLDAARREAEGRLGAVWSGVRLIWPQAPETPSLEAARAELDRLDEEIERLSADLGPYSATTGHELEVMEGTWGALSEEAARLRAEHRSILRSILGETNDPHGEDAGVTGKSTVENWSDLCASNLPAPFPSLLRLQGAPSCDAAQVPDPIHPDATHADGTHADTTHPDAIHPDAIGSAPTVDDVLRWIETLDEIAWSAFIDKEGAYRAAIARLAQTRRELDSLQTEEQNDREPERLAERLAPFTLETPREELKRRIEACAALELRAHGTRERLASIPSPEDLHADLRSAERALRSAWIDLLDAWPNAPAPDWAHELRTNAAEDAAGATDWKPPEATGPWVRAIRVEERLARDAWRESTQLRESLHRILAAAQAGTVEEVKTRMTEEHAALGALILRLENLEGAELVLAGSIEDGVGGKAHRLQAMAEEETAALSDESREAEAAGMREQELLREIASLEGAPATNLAHLEIRIGQMETELEQLHRQKDALVKAYGWVRAAAEEFQSAYREDLERRITERFRALTGVADRNVRLGDSFALSIRAGAGDHLAPEQLSQGAHDQLRLAVRLAVADLLSDSVPLPFFFDDPFVHYDAERLGHLRSALEVVGRERQWILLTHREDFKDWGSPVLREDPKESRAR